MNFEQLVGYIKNHGCPIRLYRNKQALLMSQCTGTFDVSKSGNPIIALATKNHSKFELTKILLHEYCHFLQWKDGFCGPLGYDGTDADWCWNILDKWVRGKEYSKDKIELARAQTLILEYDAEIRTYLKSKELDIYVGNNYFKSANEYIISIKWAFLTRTWDSETPSIPCHSRIYSFDELVGPIEPEYKSLLQRLAHKGE